jgi:hypothetical protein
LKLRGTEKLVHLDEHNPREAQAKGVIHAWVEEGYSLRYVVVEALLSFGNNDAGHHELNEVVEQLQDLILTLDRPPVSESPDTLLPNSFLDAVKQSARSGVKV